MLKSSRAFEDLARVAGGTASVFSGVRQQISEEIRARIDDLALRLDLVPRDEFERLETQVAALQREIELLKKNSKSKPKKSKT